MRDLFSRINEWYPKMSKGQKCIADYIINNYERIAFMTASSLGDAVSVSESTVVRFAKSVGYDGYPHMQQELRERLSSSLTTAERFEMSKQKETEKNHVKSAMLNDIESIKKTVTLLDEKMLMTSAEKLTKARRIYVYGQRSSKVLCEYLGFYLNYMLDNVNVLSSGTQDVFDQLFHATEEDVVVFFSFPRYSNRTIEVLEFCKEKGISSIGITDSHSSPIAKSVDYLIEAKFSLDTFIDSLVAPMSLINGLIVAVSMYNFEAVEANFKELEEIWQQFSVYAK